MAELLPASQVLDEDELSVELARPINVLVAKCIASLPWLTMLSKLLCCAFDRCSVMCVGSFILLGLRALNLRAGQRLRQHLSQSDCRVEEVVVGSPEERDRDSLGMRSASICYKVFRGSFASVSR